MFADYVSFQSLVIEMCRELWISFDIYSMGWGLFILGFSLLLILVFCLVFICNLHFQIEIYNPSFQFEVVFIGTVIGILTSPIIPFVTEEYSVGILFEEIKELKSIRVWSF